MLQRYSAKWPSYSATAPSVQLQRYSAKSASHSATAPGVQGQHYSTTAAIQSQDPWPRPLAGAKGPGQKTELTELTD